MNRKNYLDKATAELQKRTNRQKKRSNFLFTLFYLLNGVSLIIDASEEYVSVGHTLAYLLVAFAVIGLGIVAAYYKTRSQKLINIATLVYALSVSAVRFCMGSNGILGVAEVMISIIWVFGFMDIPYAAALNYSLFVFRFFASLGLPWLPVRVERGEDEIIWYLLATLVASVAAHWAEYKVRQIETFRDHNLRLAVQYCAELEQANQAKSQFLSNMSHDIRTPMNAIAGYTNIARLHLDDQAQVEECLDKIEAAEKHLGDIINDVLDMSRIETGKEELMEETTSLQEVFREVSAIVLPAMEQKKLHLSEDTGNVCHSVVRADASKLRRILVNILGNAVKYTGEGGTISSRLTETPGTKENCSCYTFCVKDSGIGMSEEYVAHIFEPFSRERTSISGSTQGTGLGMPIAKKYAELMGGTVHVESTQGVGTTVTVTVELPWEKGIPDEKSQEMPKAPVVIAGKCGLCVDDSTMNREIAAALLENVGVQVKTAADGKEALEILNASADEEFDFVLMDVLMPVMNGMETTRILRSSERPYLRNLPVIAVTANAFVEDRAACLAAGMNGFVSKPFTVENIIQQLTQLEK